MDFDIDDFSTTIDATYFVIGGRSGVMEDGTKWAHLFVMSPLKSSASMQTMGFTSDKMPCDPVVIQQMKDVKLPCRAQLKCEQTSTRNAAGANVPSLRAIEFVRPIAPSKSKSSASAIAS